MANLRTNNLSGEQGQNAYRGSVYFDGEDNSNLAITSNSDFTFGTGVFTAECWIFIGSYPPSNVYGILDTGTSVNANRFSMHVYPNGKVYIDNNTNLIISDTILSTFSWHHLAFVREGTGSNESKLYINGVLDKSATISTDFTNDDILIGKTIDNYEFKGYISNARITKGEAVYTANFTPSLSELTADANTVLLCCQDSDDPTQEETGKTITASGNLAETDLVKQQPKVIPPYGVDAGNTFGGTIQQSSQGYMYFPTGRTEERGRGRGLYGGGGISTPTNPANIAYIDVQSQGNTTRFGDLTTSNRVWIHGFGSSTRAIWSGGGNTGGSNTANTIDFVTIATTSNATDFGDATVAALARASLSNDTRGLSACGFISPANINTIDFVNVANLGNATDFGDATVTRRGVARMGSSTRGIFAGGMTPSASDVMDFVTIASTGNAQDFGNLVVAARHDSGGCSNGTRGIIAGGNTPSGDVNTIQFVTIASAGDASDFGDLQQTMEACGSLDNTIRGVFSGSYTPSLNTMNFITIATTGNALDFGDNTDSNYAAGGTSDSHGGLS